MHSWQAVLLVGSIQLHMYNCITLLVTQLPWLSACWPPSSSSMLVLMREGCDGDGELVGSIGSDPTLELSS